MLFSQNLCGEVGSSQRRPKATLHVSPWTPPAGLAVPWTGPPADRLPARPHRGAAVPVRPAAERDPPALHGRAGRLGRQPHAQRPGAEGWPAAEHWPGQTTLQLKSCP